MFATVAIKKGTEYKSCKMEKTIYNKLRTRSLTYNINKKSLK